MARILRVDENWGDVIFIAVHGNRMAAVPSVVIGKDKRHFCGSGAYKPIWISMDSYYKDWVAFDHAPTKAELSNIDWK